jgi:hypothetical protein
MDFETHVDFIAPVTSAVAGYYATFRASIAIDGEGVPRGTWAFDTVDIPPGVYLFFPTHVSGPVSAVGGLTGPWSVWLGGTTFTSQASTLTYANGQFTLTVDARLVIGPEATPIPGTGDGTPGTTIHASQRIGSTGNDTILAGAGNSSFDGGLGIDTVVFSDARENYTITRDSHGGWEVVHNAEVAGTTTLANIERLQFADSKLAIDISGHGGQAYRLYQAAFDRVPDVGGLGYQMHDLDAGYSLSQVAANFIASPEFQSKYGTNLSDAEFVHLLYLHVLHREPGDFEVSYHVDHELHAGYSRADVLTFFSESPENQTVLIGTIGNGMVYVFP